MSSVDENATAVETRTQNFLNKKKKSESKKDREIEKQRERPKRRENWRKFSSLYISDAFASFQHHHSFSDATNNSTETIKEGNHTSNANIHAVEDERKNKKINLEQACNVDDNLK